MTKVNNIFLGWGLVGLMAATTIVCMPKLAEASADLKTQAQWETRAQAFTQTNTDKTSSLVSTLASAQLDAKINNIWMRDFQTTGLKQKSNLILASKQTIREAQCLSEAIYYEARSEKTAGQKAVAEVILNRVKSKHFPNTICGVVYQGAERTTGCQFSFACDGSNSILPSGKTWGRSQKIAKHMMLGMSSPLTNRSTHYHTENINPHWASSLRQTRQYGTHVFYRFMPRKSSMRSVSVAP